MSTTPDTAKLAAIGMRFRGPYLVQQAGYTIGIASLEGAPLTALLPPDFLEKVALLRDEVDKALQDKTLRASEAKQATSSQNQQMHAASKIVNNAGHELYAHDMAAAARFNLSILHRRGFQLVEPTPPQPTPPADKPTHPLP